MRKILRYDLDGLTDDHLKNLAFHHAQGAQLQLRGSRQKPPTWHQDRLREIVAALEARGVPVT